jgi:hypothetical protein
MKKGNKQISSAADGRPTKKKRNNEQRHKKILCG